MKRYILLTIAIIVLAFSPGCKEEKQETGKVTFLFKQLVDYVPLEVDTMAYTNEAGNEYMITEVQYFISNLVIHYGDGTEYAVKQDDGIHYIDNDIPESGAWEIEENVPAGIVDRITFTFGLDENDNVSNRFVNPPETGMYWPEPLGGGYHYMKLNGKWLASDNEIKPFNFHLGIGQLYDTTGNVISFVQNYFEVTCKLPVYSSLIIDIQPDKMNHLDIGMNIDSWFKTPNTWDFNYWGGMMMQNQDALEEACENGNDVFVLSAGW